MEGGGAPDGRQRPFDRTQHFGDADLRSRPVEPVPALSAPTTGDDARRPQLAEDVLKELQRVVSMDSKKDDPQMHGLLAQKLKDAGQVREAAAEYQVASSLDPRNLYFLKQEGFCHNRDKNYEEALRCLGEALRRDPADYVVRNTLEKIYSARGEMKKFLPLLEEILREHPEQKPILGTVRRIRKKMEKEGDDE